MKKFVVVMNIPSPYRLHLLGEMHKQLQARGVEFMCHFMAKWHADRPLSWRNPKIDFPHRYWTDFGIGQYHFNPGLILRMLFVRPDYLLCGSSFDTFTGIFLMSLVKAKVKIAGLEGNTQTPGQMGGFRGWVKRFVLSRCRYVHVPGAESIRYMAMHQSRTARKMPETVILPNLVDETRFKPREKWPEKDIEELRNKLGVERTDKLCLIPARIEECKGLLPFVKQLDCSMVIGWKVLIIGEGSLKGQLVSELKFRGLENNFILLDYMPYSDMPKLYASSDLLLLPSIYDPNPLSVVEALHSGLPVALSSQAGNVEEAIEEGKNGWVLPVMDKISFNKQLKDVFSSIHERLREMGRYSHSVKAKFWNTKQAMSSFLDKVL